MHPIVIIAMLFGGIPPGAPPDAVFLVGQARALVTAGEPAKALMILERVRGADSLQVQVDRLRARCQASLGQWVPAQDGSDWMVGDDRLSRASRENPDSLFRSAQDLFQKEDIAAAARIAGALAQSNTATPAYLKFSQELRSRQEAKIAFHADLARKAQSRGDFEDVALQWRLAWTVRPEDAILREQVRRSEDVRQAAIHDVGVTLSGLLVAKDEAGAYEVASKAAMLFPGVWDFRKANDSLRALRMAARKARVDRINLLADQGLEQEAMDSMESLVESDPSDPSLELAQSMLQTRLQKRRKRIQLTEYVKACESAVAAGDILRASEVLVELRRLGAEGSEFERLPPRVDSLRATRKAQEAFDEAMGSARAALRSGDALSARAGLQRALVLQPASMVAKSLLASLAAPRPVPVAAAVKPVTNPVSVAGSAPSPENALKAKDLLLAGVAAYRSGEYERAIQSWKRVLEIDSGCVQARKYLANVGLKQTRLK